MKFAILLLTTFVASSLSQNKWDGLRVTWNPDVNNPDYFVKFPRTESDAINEGFTKIGDCDLKAKWRGKRYVRGDDYSVGLLYDVNGYIAGIQTAVPKSSNYPPLKLQPPFINEGNRSVLTAYFTKPSKICTTGRSAEEFATQGTGSNLYIQNSTTPELSTRVPSTLAAVRRTTWTQTRCLTYMGLHFYHNFTLELSCDELFPVGLLYTKGRLTGFAWIFVAYLPSKRYEIAEKRFFPDLLGSVPTCLNEYDVITSQHIYLIDDISVITC